MSRLQQYFPLVFVLACATVPGHVAAQSLAGLPANARVRVETMNGNLETGRVVAARRDSLWLRIDRVDSVAAYSAAGLRTFAVSLGSPHGHGARRGALISGALGLIAVGLSLHADLTTRDDIIIPATLFVAPAAVVFTLVGTGLGALLVEERWATPEVLRLGLAVGGGSTVGVAYRIAF